MKSVVRSRFFAFWAGPIARVLGAAILASALAALEIASPANAFDDKPLDNKTIADAAVSADNKIALVIGNSQYRKVQPLANPANDAADIAASLQRLGYSVQHFTDLDYEGFRRALIEFGKAAKNADKAVIFYAGHGVEIDGKNWLIPVDAEIRSEIDVYAEGVNLEALIDLSVLPKVVGLVVLDACRNNPFAATASGGRSLSNVDKAAAASTDSNTTPSAAPDATALPGTAAGGLAPVDVTDNVLVAFSAAAGTTANDGAGRNSPYSGALLRHIEKPGLEINYLFRDIHDDVLKETLNTQEPAVYGTLSKDEIFLNERDARVAAADSEGAAEKLAWSFVRTTNDISVLRRFSAQFPASSHRADILARTAQLESAEKFAWDMVERQHSASAYQAFLDLYPFGDHADNARVTLASLATSSPPDAAGVQAIDLPKPPPATFDLASASAEVIDKPDESSDAIEKAWDVLKGSQDLDVVGRFSDKFPSLRHNRVPRNSDFSLRPVNSTDWMLKTAGDDEVNGCFAGQSESCVKAIEKYPDYVQLRFQLCRTTRQRGDASADRRGAGDNGCMIDAVEDARDRGYLVSAFTRSGVERKRNQEYRKAVKQVQDRVSTVVSNTVSNVVSNVVNSTVSNVVSTATSAAIGRATSVAIAPPSVSIVIPAPTARWDSRLGSIRSAVAVAPPGNRAGAAVISAPAISVAPKGLGGAAPGAAAAGAAGAAASGAAGSAAGKAASGAASNAAGKAASGAASNAASKAASGAASNAASKAASAAASGAASKAASGAASNAASKAASAAASNAASKAASNAASHSASRAASLAASNAAGRAASNAASNAASRAAAHAASKAASAAASNAASRVSIPSDIRLKQDIVALGRTNDGLQLYRYRYIGDGTLYVGVMAQEVAEQRPDAVVRGADGYFRVNYGKLGLPFLTFEEWTRRHAAGTED
jgi:uncharacterized caspase-like protein